MDIKQDIGNRIRMLRKKRGFSQEHFSHLCDLDRTYIASIEQGKRNVSIVNLQKIAKAFELTLSDFLKDI